MSIFFSQALMPLQEEHISYGAMYPELDKGDEAGGQMLTLSAATD